MYLVLQIVGGLYSEVCTIHTTAHPWHALEDFLGESVFINNSLGGDITYSIIRKTLYMYWINVVKMFLTDVSEICFRECSKEKLMSQW